MKRPTYSTPTYSTRAAGAKVAIYRHTIHYPRGLFVLKLANQVSADAHTARQVAEDATFRAAKIADYLAERAARPVAAAEPTNQLNLF